MIATHTPAQLPSLDDLPDINASLDGAEPHEIIKYAAATYCDTITMACSFQDMVMLDIVAKVAPGIRVFTLDTGFLFKQTEDTIARARARYPELSIEVFHPLVNIFEQADEYGPRLYARDPEQCCAMRKLEPMQRALSGYSAWMTGIRRDQSDTRADTQPLSWDIKWNIAKFAPMYAWSSDDIWTYAKIHDVPYNPMHDAGYPSIGCAPCTDVPDDDHHRSGRWSGSDKTECGLHAEPAAAIGVPGRVDHPADHGTPDEVLVETEPQNIGKDSS